MYDIIGDIHGHGDELVALFERLEYRYHNGHYFHPSRKAVFVGDFIDRGPQILGTLKIVRGMIDAGAAQAVMGNHEFNAIAFHTEKPEPIGRHYREHDVAHVKQHIETLKQLSCHALSDFIEWFKTLPVALELDGLRVVHACWSRDEIVAISTALEKYGQFTPEFLHHATNNETDLFHAVENVLKGPEIALPTGKCVPDKEGQLRHKMRIRWFESALGRTYAAYALSGEVGFPVDLLNQDADQVARPYPIDAAPVFFGHYWLTGGPEPLSPNVACVDYSVAKQGCLCAYRWNGEREIRRENFITVPARDCIIKA